MRSCDTVKSLQARLRLQATVLFIVSVCYDDRVEIVVAALGGDGDSYVSGCGIGVLIVGNGYTCGAVSDGVGGVVRITVDGESLTRLKKEAERAGGYLSIVAAVVTYVCTGEINTGILIVALATEGDLSAFVYFSKLLVRHLDIGDVRLSAVFR